MPSTENVCTAFPEQPSMTTTVRDVATKNNAQADNATTWCIDWPSNSGTVITRNVHSSLLLVTKICLPFSVVAITYNSDASESRPVEIKVNQGSYRFGRPPITYSQ
jgi:hypothetical protein